MAYTVTAPMVAVSVPIGAHTSQVWFLGQGSPLPEGIEDASVAHLLSMGMMMLPPVMVSLPFKLLLFVMVDGWALVIKSLVASYGGG